VPCPRRALVVLVALLCLAVSGCGGGSDSKPAGTAASPDTSRALTVWFLEDQPDRIRATRANVAEFARRTGYRVDLVAMGEEEVDGRLQQAQRSGTGPDVVQLPVESAHAYARSRVLSSDAAQEVVNRLGEETFSARALSLLTSDAQTIAVPSDGWGQLLIYRKDLFARAGLPAPQTLDDVRRAARRLDRPGRAGITLATTTGPFTSQTFEHVALAEDCQLLDDAGRVRLTSPACRRAFAAYVDLTRHSPGGRQDVDSTRAAYFAGRAAMVFWSPFLLDAMAGLRDDAKPTCPQCRADPSYLARQSGLVGPLTTPRGDHAQYGTISTWGILADGDLTGAERFVEYMMSDGYVRWLATSPQGKYPVRLGDRAQPERYVDAWSALRSGVDRKAPLKRFYSPASLASIGDGARSFQRWGFEQGQAALLGALRGPQPISKALGAATSGRISADEAARRSQAAVEKLSAASPAG
jgi:multiple sugar transport system substrate-binding protein